MAFLVFYLYIKFQKMRDQIRFATRLQCSVGRMEKTIPTPSSEILFLMEKRHTIEIRFLR